MHRFLIVRKLIRVLASLVTICAVTVPLAVHAVTAQKVSTHSASTTSQDITKQEVISRARGAYYNLARHGFSGFKAEIEPNWEVILGPSASQESLNAFRALRFSMTVDAAGAVTVSHQVVNKDEARLERYARQIHNDIQRLLAAFFGAWSMFTISSPFPPTESNSKVENSDKKHRISYTTQSADAILTLTSDLLITELKFTGQRAKRTIKPLFQKTAEGLLLTSYQTFFEPVGEGIKTTLNISVEHQDVSGMKLPHKVQIKGMHGSEPVAAELTFKQYVLNPRPTTN